MMKNNRHTLAIMLTTVAVALFGLFWTVIAGKLDALDIRLRAVEQQIAAISDRLGIQTSSQDTSARPPAAPWLADNLPEIPITP